MFPRWWITAVNQFPGLVEFIFIPVQSATSWIHHHTYTQLWEMVGSNLKHTWFVGNGLTHSELLVLSRAEFWVASTELTIPSEATLFDLLKRHRSAKEKQTPHLSGSQCKEQVSQEARGIWQSDPRRWHDEQPEPLALGKGNSGLDVHGCWMARRWSV